jgi:hypothetical protein
MFDDDGPSTAHPVTFLLTPAGHAKMAVILFDDRHVPHPHDLAHIALKKGLAGRVFLS